MYICAYIEYGLYGVSRFVTLEITHSRSEVSLEDFFYNFQHVAVCNIFATLKPVNTYCMYANVKIKDFLYIAIGLMVIFCYQSCETLKCYYYTSVSKKNFKE